MSSVNNLSKSAVESVTNYSRKQRKDFQNSDKYVSIESVGGIELKFLKFKTPERGLDTSRRFHHVGGAVDKYRSNRVWEQSRTNKTVRFVKGKFHYENSGTINPQVAGIRGERLKSNPLPPWKHNDAQKADNDLTDSFPEPMDSDMAAYARISLLKDEHIPAAISNWTYDDFLDEDQNKELRLSFVKKIGIATPQQIEELATIERLAFERRELDVFLGVDEPLLPVQQGADIQQQGLSDAFSFVTRPFQKAEVAMDNFNSLVTSVAEDKDRFIGKASEALDLFTSLGYASYKLYDLKCVLEDLDDPSKPILYRYARLCENLYHLFQVVFPATKSYLSTITPDRIIQSFVPSFFSEREVEQQGWLTDVGDLSGESFRLVSQFFGLGPAFLQNHSLLFRNFNTFFTFCKNVNTASEKLWSAICTAAVYVANYTNATFMRDWIMRFDEGKLAEYNRLYRAMILVPQQEIGENPLVDTTLAQLVACQRSLKHLLPIMNNEHFRMLKMQFVQVLEWAQLQFERTEGAYGRLTPFCVCAYGDSRIGKSGILNIIAHEILSEYSIEDRMFWKNDSTYWEGIREHIQGIGVDDWGAMTDSDWSMLLKVVTCNRTLLDMAFEKKGIMEFRGTLVMLATNTPFPSMSNQMNNPVAVLKRRNLLIEMDWTDECKRNGDFEPRPDNSHAVFYIHDPVDPSVNKQGPMTYEQIRAVIVKGYLKKMEKEKNYLDFKKAVIPRSHTPLRVDISSAPILTPQAREFPSEMLALFNKLFKDWQRMDQLKDTMATGTEHFTTIEKLKERVGINVMALSVMGEMAKAIFYFTSKRNTADISAKVNDVQRMLFPLENAGSIPVQLPQQQGFKEDFVVSASVGIASYAGVWILERLTAWLFAKKKTVSKKQIQALIRKYDLAPTPAAELEGALSCTGTSTELETHLACVVSDPAQFCELVESLDKFVGDERVQLENKARNTFYYESYCQGILNPTIAFDKDSVFNTMSSKVLRRLIQAGKKLDGISQEGAYSQDKIRSKRIARRFATVKQEGLPREQKEGFAKCFPVLEVPHQQGFTDPSAQTLSVNLLKVVGRIYFESGDYKNVMNFVPLKGTLIMFPRHLIIPTGSTQIAKSGVLYVEQRTSTTTGYSKPVIFDPNNLAYLRKHETQIYGVDTDDVCPKQAVGNRCECVYVDWVIYDLGRASMTTYGDYTKHFIEEKDLFSGKKEGTLVVKRAEGFSQIQLNDVRPIESAIAMKAHHAGKVEMLVRGFTYTAGTQSGDCGSPLIVCDTAITGKICGVHTAAYASSAHAFATLVTREWLEEVLRELDSTSTLISEVPTQQGNCPNEYMSGDVFPIGTVDPREALFQPGKTDYYESPLFPFLPTVKAPAILRNSDPSYVQRENGDVFTNAFKKFGKERVSVTSEARNNLKEGAQMLIDFMQTLPHEEEPRVWTDYEAVNGHNKVNRLNKHSSAGYPYCLQKYKGLSKGKSAYLSVLDNGDLELVPFMAQQVRARETAALDGVRVASIWSACLKDELRPVRRVASGTTRGFVGCPMDYTVVFRKYFGSWISFLHSNYIDNLCGVGMNCESADWTKLGEKIEQHPFFFAFDYTDWDGSIPSELAWATADVIKGYYGSTWTKAHEVLMDEMINTIIICKDELYMKRRGMPSGTPCTAEFNCLANLILIMAYFCRVWPKPTLRDFLDNVFCCVYGDDNVGSLSQEAAKYMTPDGYEQFVTELGMTVTNATKDGKVSWLPFEELTFLKRHFRKEGLLYYPLMKPETISGMITFLTDKQEGALETNLNTALRYMYFFGPEMFNEFRQMLVIMCRRADQRVALHSYDFLNSEYFGNNRFDMLATWMERKD